MGLYWSIDMHLSDDIDRSNICLMVSKKIKGNVQSMDSSSMDLLSLATHFIEAIECPVKHPTLHTDTPRVSI